MQKEFTLKTNDGLEIFYKKWNKTTQEPKAIIQVAHGMVEHIGRYDEFANYLADNNIVVYGNDHRGHGKTAESQGIFGYFAAENGFQKTTNDLIEITKIIRQSYPSTPIYLFGHSMGSFLARQYIQTSSHLIDGVILMGTGYFPKASLLAGKTMASTLPPSEKSKLMNKIVFGSYNQRIKGRRTIFDWLTRDDDEVDEFIRDPYNGFVPTARFFYDLMDGLLQIHDQNQNKEIPKNLPMLFISGDKDPVGEYAKGVWRTAHLYEELGLENITTVLYEGARHELLHEINKEEVFRTIYEWINQQCRKKNKE
ncbi:alpha/beta hydrolase [Oceanobacillus halotolerans]|uniref:alpha/beta hydrolase n=1 Tax=Oceanobacillus halotolerans TaxID=2663380 RepID=UPI0013DB66B2|nr:alpha/beta hydrolase [Oceanobacillus halotolerans]